MSTYPQSELLPAARAQAVDRSIRMVDRLLRPVVIEELLMWEQLRSGVPYNPTATHHGPDPTTHRSFTSGGSVSPRLQQMSHRPGHPQEASRQ